VYSKHRRDCWFAGLAGVKGAAKKLGCACPTGYAMRETDEYKAFVDRIFEQIADLEAESNKYPIQNALRDYGLTMAEATRLYYKRGILANSFSMRSSRQGKAILAGCHQDFSSRRLWV
jgi:hypothetical protein